MSLADLPPTMLELLGFDVPDCMTGRSFADYFRTQRAPARHPLYAEAYTPYALTYKGRDEAWRPPSLAVTDWPLRLIRIRTPEGARFELYDLESDPGERNDLYTARGHEVSALVAKLDGYEDDCRRERERLAQQLTGGKETTEPARAMDPAQQEKLRALGYLD
jgi:arylsulfatase A-like enzyme